MSIRRFVLTGAPGAGKTTIAGALQARGHVVVREAATDVVAATGGEGGELLDAILDLQLEREAAAAGDPQILDRSPLCTLALARYCGVTPPQALLAAAGRAAATYQRTVLLVRPLGFVTATTVRRISYADSLRFETIHEDVYREYGFTLAEIPKAGVAERVALIERLIA